MIRRFLVLSTLAGLVAGLVPLALYALDRPAPEASARLELGDRSVRWPYHSSLQRNSYSWMNRPETLASVQTALPGGVVQSVTADEPANNQFLVVRSHADDSQTATAAVSTAIDQFFQYDLALQADPVEAELATIQEQLQRVEAEFDDAEAVLAEASNSTDLILAQAELEGLGATLGGLRGREAEARGRLDGIQDRYVVESSPAAVPLFRDSLLAAVQLAVAGFGLALAFLTLGGASFLSGMRSQSETVQLAREVG